MLECTADLSSIQPTFPRGSLISFSCPVSCNECHRKGMAQWIETPGDCPWDTIDDRLDEVNAVCCAADGADPDVTCPRGGPPRACSPLCAVTFHSLAGDCGQKLQSLAGATNAASFTAFEQLCVSAQSVDPMYFLNAIASATCCSSENCGGCLDDTMCTPVDGCLWYADQACFAAVMYADNFDDHTVDGWTAVGNEGSFRTQGCNGQTILGGDS